jgi:ABC-type ATPase involved in cell division
MLHQPQANIDQKLKEILADILEQFNQPGLTFILISFKYIL